MHANERKGNTRKIRFLNSCARLGPATQCLRILFRNQSAVVRLFSFCFFLCFLVDEVTFALRCSTSGVLSWEWSGNNVSDYEKECSEGGRKNASEARERRKTLSVSRKSL